MGWGPGVVFIRLSDVVGLKNKVRKDAAGRYGDIAG